MSSPIQLVFFDLGGVLVHADLERYVHLGIGLFGASPEAFRREVVARVPDLERGRLDSATFWKQVGESLWIRGEGRPAPPELCRHLWRDLLASTVQVDPQVMNLCQLLREKGLRLGALTNTLEDHIPVLTALGVYRPFDPCVMSCRQGHRKPEREIYLKAAELAGLKPRACLLVDDLEENIEGARRAGMPGVRYTGAQDLLRELVRLRLLS